MKKINLINFPLFSYCLYKNKTLHEIYKYENNLFHNETDRMASHT